MYVRMTSKDSLKMNVAVVKTNHALPPLAPLVCRLCKLKSNAITLTNSVFWSQISIYGLLFCSLCDVNRYSLEHDHL
ncbi:hypothetical protein IMY05_016G0149300 [Salix suchowensis]|nr:hypothetical protein IMY05_016G0149300 [Salix suchowensis]